MKQTSKSLKNKNGNNQIKQKSYTYTGTNLMELLSQGRVTIGLNTFYKMYSENTDLRAGIWKIANKVGSKGMHFVNDQEETIDIPGLKKAVQKVLTDPERCIKTFPQWKRELIIDYYIAGEVYILPIVNGLGQLESFQILDPRTITKIHNNEGIIEKFRQQSGTTVRTWEADKIGFYKLENDRKNAINGMSKLQSVIWDVLTDNKASQRNYYFFENDKVPRAIMQLDKEYDYGDKATMAEVSKLKDGINGTDQSNKTILSNLVTDVKILEMTNKDMEFVQQRRLTTDKVCSLLGMSKDQLGYSDSINYATAQQFYINFINDTIYPLQTEIEFIINDLMRRFATDMQGINIVLETDDGVDMYKEHEDQRADVQSGILLINEVRAERGLGEKPIENTTPSGV